MWHLSDSLIKWGNSAKFLMARFIMIARLREVASPYWMRVRSTTTSIPGAYKLDLAPSSKNLVNSTLNGSHCWFLLCLLVPKFVVLVNVWFPINAGVIINQFESSSVLGLFAFINVSFAMPVWMHFSIVNYLSHHEVFVLFSGGSCWQAHHQSFRPRSTIRKGLLSSHPMPYE